MCIFMVFDWVLFVEVCDFDEVMWLNFVWDGVFGVVECIFGVCIVFVWFDFLCIFVLEFVVVFVVIEIGIGDFLSVGEVLVLV